MSAYVVNGAGVGGGDWVVLVSGRMEVKGQRWQKEGVLLKVALVPA